MAFSLRNTAAALLVVATTVLVGAQGALAAQASKTITKSMEFKGVRTLELGTANGNISVSSYDGAVLTVDFVIRAKAEGADQANALVGRVGTTVRRLFAKATFEADFPRIPSNAQLEVGLVVKVPAGWSGGLEAVTTNGNITITDWRGAINVATTNGTVGASLPSVAQSCSLRSTNGPVKLEVSSPPTSNLSLETKNGNIELSVPSSSKLNLDATVANGSICLSGLGSGTTTVARHITTQVNGGGPKVFMSSNNGNINARGL